MAEQDPASEADPGSEIALTMEREETVGGGGGDGDCHESYPDQCLSSDAGDYDCAEGSGDGPEHATGPLQVDHSVSDPDPFDLDRDGDGTGCDGG